MHWKRTADGSKMTMSSLTAHTDPFRFVIDMGGHSATTAYHLYHLAITTAMQQINISVKCK